MEVTVAPAVLALFTQADLQAPDRDRASDGTVASTQHHKQNPDSDHDPDASGWVYAGDLTDDDAHGIDCRKIAAQIVARKDRRVKYLIHEGRMVSSYPTSRYPAWTWRPYSGPNGHFKHLHVSVLKQWRNDTRTWWTATVPDLGGGKGTSAPTGPAQEDDVTKDEVREVVQAELAKLYGNPTKDEDPTHISLADLNRKLNTIIEAVQK